MTRRTSTQTPPARTGAPPGAAPLAKQQESSNRLAGVKGTWRTALDCNSRMEWATRHAHLVSPATSIGAMPEGCGVALTVVHVDVQADTYDVGLGKRGLSKSVLQRLGHALGVSWDPAGSGRVDDGSHPYYVRWRAIGHYRSFDGQVHTLLAEKELDLRDGSPTCEALEQQQRRKGKSAENQIREMRAHIQSHAETKAQLRAIRSLGIKTSYTAAELAKPFVAARVMFTGQTDDPELRRRFAELTAQSFMGASRMLFGDAGASSLQATTAPPRRLSAPPPVGSVPADLDDFAAGDDEPAPEQPVTNRSQPVDPQSQAWTIPGGRAKGTPLTEAPIQDLEYWAKRIGGDIDQGNSRDPERDQALHAALCDEIARRERDGAAAEADQGGQRSE